MKAATGTSRLLVSAERTMGLSTSANMDEPELLRQQATARISLPHQIAFSEVAALTDLLWNEFSATEISRTHPRSRLTGGPGFEGVLIAVAVAAGATGVVTFAKQFFTRLADDAYDGLRSAIASVTRRARRPQRDDEPMEWAFTFENARDVDGTGSRITFSARGDDPEELRRMADAALQVLTQDAGSQVVGWWTWDAPYRRLIGARESATDLAAVNVRIRVAPPLGPDEAAPLAANLADRGFSPRVEVMSAPITAQSDTLLPLLVEATPSGTGDPAVVRHLAGLLASDAYRLPRGNLVWSMAYLTERIPDARWGFLVRLGIDGFVFAAGVSDPTFRAQLRAAQDVLDQSMVSNGPADLDTEKGEGTIWRWEQGGWRRV